MVGDAELRQLTSRAGCLLERCLLRTADENQSGLVAVGEVVHRLTVDLLARLQSRELSKTRSSVLARLDERGPGRWQLEHAQGVTGRSCVENDMVVLTCIFRIGKEVGELIEGGNLHSAGARELFFHVGDGGVGQYTTVGTYYRLTIFVGCFDGIEIDNRQSPHFCNGCAVL